MFLDFSGRLWPQQWEDDWNRLLYYLNVISLEFQLHFYVFGKLLCFCVARAGMKNMTLKGKKIENRERREQVENSLWFARNGESFGRQTHQGDSSHSRHQQWPWNSLSNLSVSNNESPTSEPLANSKHRAVTMLFITSSSRLMTWFCYFSNWIERKKTLLAYTGKLHFLKQTRLLAS